MSRCIFALLYIIVLVQIYTAKPVDPNKKSPDAEKKKAANESEELDDFGLEYGRYLQQVVQALEEDKEFAKKLENVTSEQIKTGKIAHELEFVKHNVRTKLDELKRIEVDRLRKLAQRKMESEIGLYRDEDGRLLSSPDGRRWRTITGRPGLDRKGAKIPQHLDFSNPRSFEIDDLKKLIHSATKDLEELDKQRRESFKKYELEKEATYREGLKNMTEEQRKEAEKHHEELIQKHKEHPKVHHPGSKDQLQEVWEEEDHMPKEEFNPKTFFAMHDINGDGYLDVDEVEAVVRPEIRKMYDPKNEEDDPAEMEEEYHRMREHIFNETDKDRDGLISVEEFLKMTDGEEFQQDEGWKGLDEQNVYSEAELEEFMRQRQLEMNQQYYGDPRAYYDVQHAQQGVPPPHINYGDHVGMPPQQQYHPPAYPSQGHQDQQHFQGVPPPQQQHYGVPPQQQQHYQGVPSHQQQQQHYQGVPPQQQQQQQHYQGVPPQQQQQQHYQGVPPQQQQHYQGVPPQQQQQQHYQGVPQQQQHYQGAVPNQPHQGNPQQQHGVPLQQQYQGSPSQPQGVPSHQGIAPQQQPHDVNKPNPPSPNINQIPNGKVEVPNLNAIPQQQQQQPPLKTL